MSLLQFLYDQANKVRKLIPFYGRLDGFEDPANVGVSYDYTTRKITLTHSSGTIAYWHKGFRYTKTSPYTFDTAHTNSAGTYFLSIGDDDVWAWETAFWDLSARTPVAYVNFNNPSGVYFAVREPHGLMDWESHLEMHERFGTYRRSGGLLTAGTYSVSTGGDTDANVTPGTDQIVVADEDLQTTIPALTQGTYTRLHFINSVAVFTPGSSFPFPYTGNSPQINTGGTSLTTITSNNTYFNVYVIYMPVTSDSESQKYRVLWMISQNTYTSLATAQAEDIRTLNFGNLLSLASEFVPFLKMTYRFSTAYGGTARVRIEAEPLPLVGGKAEMVTLSGITPSTHNNLSGRTDADCHPGSAIALTPSGTQTYSDVATSIQHLYDKYPGFTDYVEKVTGSSKQVFTLTGIAVAADHKIDILVDGRDQPFEGDGSSDNWLRTVGDPGVITMAEALDVGRTFKARVYSK